MASLFSLVVRPSSTIVFCRSLPPSSSQMIIEKRYYASKRPYSDEVTYRLNKLNHKYEKKKKEAQIQKGYIPETLDDDYKREETKIINEVRREYSRGPSPQTKSSKGGNKKEEEEEELPEGFEYVERPF